MAWYEYEDKKGDKTVFEQCGICGTQDSENQPHYAKGLCESCYQKWIRGGKEKFPDFEPTDIVRRIKKRKNNHTRRCAFCEEPEATLLFGTSLCVDHIEQYKSIIMGTSTPLVSLFAVGNA